MKVMMMVARGGTETKENGDDDEDKPIQNYEHPTSSSKEPLILPRRIYLQALGGNMEMAKQLDALCCCNCNNCTRQYNTTSVEGYSTVESVTTTLFYKFTPCLNFHSPKTIWIKFIVSLWRIYMQLLIFVVKALG
eukprot:CAMPEP_0197838806 /NCGR_PEP_ID=MMETSP1437-20131217/39109_1 /TAXON_ID=49252 ORGANISM="Eucampia antarctica, Strain CCMP1452" /NCGR_SAMPLE_ID=MMETSP1437 /ASSEMBLY_ACC=CAM_ASM_001096 /LENGTH=134 /DNA_ID=CAMNT_0043447195 /DNA_START=1155 /DNA_END=1555 /DNA_ORIENTATION=-